MFLDKPIQVEKTTSQNCPTQKRKEKSIVPDIQFLNQKYIQDILRNSYKKKEIGEKKNLDIYKNIPTHSVGQSGKLISKNFITFSFNIPNSLCFVNSEWSEFQKTLDEFILKYFDYTKDEKTIIIRKIHKKYHELFLSIFTTLNQDLIELDNELPHMSIYKVLDAKKCPINLKCQVMASFSQLETFDLTINVQKISKESNSIDLRMEQNRIEPIANATHMFNFEDLKEDLNLERKYQVYKRKYSAEWLKKFAEKTSHWNQTTEFKDNDLSESKGIDNFLKRQRVNYFTDPSDSFSFKSRPKMNAFELEKDTTEVYMELSDFVIVGSKYSGPDYTSQSLYQFKQEAVLIDHQQNRTIFHWMGQEIHDESDEQWSTRMNMNQLLVEYAYKLWVNRNETKESELKKRINFFKELSKIPKIFITADPEEM